MSPDSKGGKGSQAVSPDSKGGKGSQAVSPDSKGGKGFPAVSPDSKGGKASQAVSPNSKGGKGSQAVSPDSKGKGTSSKASGKGKCSAVKGKGKPPNKGTNATSDIPGILKRSGTSENETPDRSVRRRVSFDSAVSTSTGQLASPTILENFRFWLSSGCAS